MRKTSLPDSSQIRMFPTGESLPSTDPGHRENVSEWKPPNDKKVKNNWEPLPGREVVLSGSFRRDIQGLQRIHEELHDLGCVILSPANIDPAREVDGFVFMRGEETETPEHIELRHLEAIQKAAFVWLHAPEGYVGLSAALEVGFAHAQGIPVFSRTAVADATLAGFVHQVQSTVEVVSLVEHHRLPPPKPNLGVFQRYYKRVASQRGYERETAQNCLLLMIEEIGELASALRKREKLKRHGSSRNVNEAHELADVFLYVVHMANILGLDLGTAVQDKENLNAAKFVASR